MKWYVLNGYHQSVLKKLLKKKSLKKNREKTNLEKKQFFSMKKTPGFVEKNQTLNVWNEKTQYLMLRSR